MLKLKNITVQFGQQKILHDLSCHAQPGDFIVIVGSNGAGKSTFFDTIAGKIRPALGTVTIDGKDVTHFNEQQRACMVTRIFQNTHLNSVGSLTVAQNLAIAQYSRRPAQLIDGMTSMPRALAEDLIRTIGMDTSILDKPMQALSGGQRQLIAFAMATQHIPKILLLDEPTAALDPQAATRLLQHARAFIKKHKVTTLLITHDPYIALNMGNKIWILQDGNIVQEYTSEQKKHLDPNKLIGQIDYAKLTDEAI
jgi:putative ABC transport system ATP-binding protein